MGGRATCGSVVMLLLLAPTVCRSKIFNPTDYEDVLSDTLKSMREERNRIREKWDDTKKTDVEAYNQKSTPLCMATSASPPPSWFSYFSGENSNSECGQGKDEEEEGEWNCDCHTFDCYDDEPVDCECERELEIAQQRIFELEEKLLQNGISIH